MERISPEDIVLRTTQVADAIGNLTDFIDLMSESRNARLASVTGDTRVGKTSISKAILELYPPTVSVNETRIPVLFVSVGSAVTIRHFYDDILTALQVPKRSSDTIGLRQERVRTFLERFGVEVLVLDEFQHLESTRGINRDGVCDTIKTLMNEGRSIIAMGNSKMDSVIGHDTQLIGRRIMDIRLYPFCDPTNPRFHTEDGENARQAEFGEYCAILKSFSEGYGCSNSEYLLSSSVSREILGITGGYYGLTHDLIRQAALYETKKAACSKDAATMSEIAITREGLLYAQRLKKPVPVKGKDGGALGEFLNSPERNSGTKRPRAGRDAVKGYSLLDDHNRKGKHKPSKPPFDNKTDPDIEVDEDTD
jgi:hypothetical protein